MTNICHLSSAAFSELNHFLYLHIALFSFTLCMIVFIEVEFAPFFCIIIIYKSLDS